MTTYTATYAGNTWTATDLQELFREVRDDLIKPHWYAMPYDDIVEVFQKAGRGLPSVSINGLTIKTQ